MALPEHRTRANLEGIGLHPEDIDLVHHPIVFLEPALVNLGDWDPELARRTRQALFERCVDTSTLLLTMHFPAPTAGRLVS